MNAWKLKRTQQCSKCPWRMDVNPHDIPNGYDPAKHAALKVTIANQDNPLEFLTQKSAHVMCCHEDHAAHCIGWLMNQIGDGNNIGLRIRMLSCSNGNDIKLAGDQHETFEDTLPNDL